VAIEIAAGIAELRRSLYLLACFLLGWYATDIVAWLKGVLR